jgi:hypothetical protein
LPDQSSPTTAEPCTGAATPPLVSIIIPCRDAAAWLAASIESCLAQSWRNCDLIVVDDGSSDASLAVARSYESSSVAVIESCHKGAAAARNLGLQHARGDLTQFLDADDVLDRDKIRTQVERLFLAPVGSVASGGWARFRDDPSKAYFVAEPVWRDLSGDEFLISSWSGGGMMPNFAWLTPRAVIDKAGAWNESLSVCDDGEFFCRVVLAAAGIVFCDGARGYYRSGAASTLSQRRDREALASTFKAVELSCARLLEQREPARAAQACATHYQRFVCDAYPAAPDLIAAAERRVAELGGSDLRPQGGRAFKLIAAWLGWKIAKRCQSAWRKLSAPVPARPEWQ